MNASLLAACRRSVLCAALAWLTLAFDAAAWAQPEAGVGNIRDGVPSDDDFRRHIQLDYREALKRNQLDKAARELVGKAVHYYMWLQVDPSQALNRSRNRKKLLDDFRFANTTDAARLVGYEQVILRARQMFNEPDADVRINACYVLNELNVSWNPDVPYAPAADALIETMAFPDDKYLQVKLVAAKGVGRILRDAPANALNVLKRFELSDKLASEIKRLQTNRGQPGGTGAIGHQWAMWHLVDALGQCDRVYNQGRQPLYVDTLL
ncbi:MAG: hypothetical protein KDA75_14975, partial [Planctomycetaceae bacterium]|nr:hypothetical protein [Planctomycetaceae bacterium]